MCGHFISDPSHGIKGDRGRNFNSLELMCPICKKPSNVQLPVYEQSMIDLLSKSSTPLEVSDADFLAKLINELADTIEHTNRQGWWRDTTCYKKHSLARFELQSDHIQLTRDRIYAFIRESFVANEKVLNKINPSTRTGVEEMADALVEILRYSELYGFVPTIQNFGQVYSSLYMTFRLMIITEAEKHKDKPELIETRVFSSMLGCLLAVVFKELETEDFLKIDLNALYCRAAVLIVISLD